LLFGIVTLPAIETAGVVVSNVTKSASAAVLILNAAVESDGIVAPDAGGYIVVGTSGTDMAEDEIEPAAPTVAAIQSGLATSSALTTVNGNVTAIKAKTDNLPTDPADESLLEAAITAATSGLSTLTTSDIDARLAAYDAATGAESAAILAAIAALNNLSSAGAQAAAAAALAAYDAATGTDVATIAATVAASNPTPNKAGAITMQRGATFDATLNGLSIPVSLTSARLTVKRLSGDSDESAVLQILVSNPGDGSDGLQRVNGSTSGVVAANASLVVNQAEGTVAIHIEDDATILLATGVYCYDCKIYYGSSDSIATAIATWNVTGIVTAAV